MRILELKNCSRESIQAMIPKIADQGFDAIQINNSNVEDVKSIRNAAYLRGIQTILEFEKYRPDSLIISSLNRIVEAYRLRKLTKGGVKNFKVSDFDYQIELFTPFLDIDNIYHDCDYKNVENDFRADPNDIAYLADYNLYTTLTDEEKGKYRMFLADLYVLLTASYENTLYSPVVNNGGIDTSFLNEGKIKEANKQLVRRINQ